MLHAIPLLAFLDVGLLVLAFNELSEGLWLTHFAHVDDGITSPDVELLKIRGLRSGGF